MYFIGLALRTCLQDNQWDDNINLTLCNSMELLLLKDRANELEDLIRNNNNIINPSVLSEVQAISEELTMLTDTPDRPLLPNDLKTSNSVLNNLIRYSTVCAIVVLQYTFQLDFYWLCNTNCRIYSSWY